MLNSGTQFWAPVAMLVWRELARFYRQPSRVIGALGSPLLFWALLGSGFNRSFEMGGGNGYLFYFFPGTICLVILFTSIFSTISVIEDRNDGFLQSVLVAPVSRGAIAAGKILGGALLAFCQALLLLIFCPLVGYHPGPSEIGLILVVLMLMAFCLTALGFFFAWRLNSVQGFHSVMNLVLFPMWFLSGALFPLTSAPLWLKALMALNPLTYGSDLLRRALEGRVDVVAAPLAITLGFGLVFFVAAWLSVGQRPKESLS